MDEEYYQQKYDKLASEKESWRRCAYATPEAQDMKFKAALKLLDFKKHKMHLDVGCGDGKFIGMLHERYDHLKSVGIDISENMIKRARGDYPFARFHYWEILSNNGKFDCITCIGVIQCIESAEQMLIDLRKVAEPLTNLLIIGLDGTVVDPANKPDGYDKHDRDPRKFAEEVESCGWLVTDVGGITQDGYPINTHTRDFYLLARKVS